MLIIISVYLIFSSESGKIVGVPINNQEIKRMSDWFKWRNQIKLVAINPGCSSESPIEQFLRKQMTASEQWPTIRNSRSEAETFVIWKVCYVCAYQCECTWCQSTVHLKCLKRSSLCYI